MNKPAENKPEDDVVTVTMVAANLLGRTCQDWRSAASQARQGLRACRDVIGYEQTDEEIRQEAYERDPQVHVGEKYFIRLLVRDLVKTRRADRQKDFAERWWTRLVALHPEAPSLTDPQTWTLETLAKWEPVFTYIYREERRNINRTNRRPKRQKRAWEIKKDGSEEVNCRPQKKAA